MALFCRGFSSPGFSGDFCSWRAMPFKENCPAAAKFASQRYLFFSEKPEAGMKRVYTACFLRRFWGTLCILSRGIK
ncbi:MAG: hypothetical protein KH334_05050 [Clostridiales bacterium]|nr:hypothetical protein [Clostridiales bacterium]